MDHHQILCSILAQWWSQGASSLPPSLPLFLFFFFLPLFFHLQDGLPFPSAVSELLDKNNLINAKTILHLGFALKSIYKKDNSLSSRTTPLPRLFFNFSQ